MQWYRKKHCLELATKMYSWCELLYSEQNDTKYEKYEEHISPMIATLPNKGTHLTPLSCTTLQWRHNRQDGVSNHRRLDYLLHRFFWRRSQKTWKHRVTGLCEVNSPHKGPVTRGMFPFDDVIMKWMETGRFALAPNHEFKHPFVIQIPTKYKSLNLQIKYLTVIDFTNE